MHDTVHHTCTHIHMFEHVRVCTCIEACEIHVCGHACMWREGTCARCYMCTDVMGHLNTSCYWCIVLINVFHVHAWWLLVRYLHPTNVPFLPSFLHPFIHSSVHLFIRLSVHPSILPFIHSSVHPFIRSSIHPSIHPFIHSSFIHPAIYSPYHPSPYTPFIHNPSSIHPLPTSHHQTNTPNATTQHLTATTIHNRHNLRQYTQAKHARTHTHNLTTIQSTTGQKHRLQLSSLIDKARRPTSTTAHTTRRCTTTTTMRSDTSGRNLDKT